MGIIQAVQELKFVYRNPGLGDEGGIARLYNHAYSGGYSLPEFTQEELIRQSLAENRYLWVVGMDNGEVVGSAVAVPHLGNGSFEMGKTAVNRDYRARGIAKRMCELLREDAFERGFDMGWGTLRNEAIYRVSLNDGMTPVGYTSRHLPSGRREAQIFCVRLNHRGLGNRVVAESDIYESGIVSSIIESAAPVGIQGEYPAEVFSPMGKGGEPLCILHDHHPQDRSSEITGFGGELPDHMWALVLADKRQQIRNFRRMGFEVTAFLPGWHAAGGRRYDCVVMENSDCEPHSGDRVIQGIIDGFREGFRGIRA